MKMNKEEYERLLKRFALELHEVGVTEEMIKLAEAEMERIPNIASISKNERVREFTYRHNGYIIEAKTTVDLVIKKCKP